MHRTRPRLSGRTHNEFMKLFIAQVAMTIATTLLSFFMQIYLDYNASAPLMPAARAAVVAGLDLLNASSVHGFGRAARLAVTHARGILADYLAVRPAQIVFTGSATEAIVTALRGVAVNSVVTIPVEHEAVRITAQALPGHVVIPVDDNGLANLESLDAVLKNSAAPALVAIQFANNETGVIQPIADVIKLARRHKALVLCDAVQALGRIDLSPLFGADMIALSAHKMGGPKGVGALVLREGLSLTPLLTGGGQEERRRAGTENVAAIMGMGAAVENIASILKQQEELAVWREHMEQQIAAAMPAAQFFGLAAPRLANTSMFALPGVAASTQLMNLDLTGIAVSSGSACSSGKVGPSHVLMAMSIAPEVAGAAIRVSGGWASTAVDFQQFTQTYIDMARRLA